MVEPRLPADFRSGIHRGAIGNVKFSCLLEVAVCTERFSSEFRILFPKFHIDGKLVDHPRFLSVPVGMRLPVQNDVGHVTRTDNCAGHDARNFRTGAGKT